MADKTVRAGDTSDWVFALTVDNAAYNLAGKTVVLHRKAKGTGAADSFSTADTPSPKLVITGEATGQVTFSPASTTWVFAAGEYSMYFEVQAGTERLKFPNASDLTIAVKEAY